MPTMYGAKATQISKAALDTWAPGRTPTDKTKAAVERGVFVVVEDDSATATTLDDVDGFPAALKHKEFVNLARSLANNPLAA